MNANTRKRGSGSVAAAQASNGEPTPVSESEQARPDGQLSPPGRQSASEAAPQNGPRPADVLTRAGLIEILVSHSQPAVWSRTRECNKDDDFRLFECARVAEFLRELQGDRDGVELVRTGLFRHNDGEVSLHPAFAPSAQRFGTFLVLRDRTGTCFDLVTRHGTLSGRPSLFACSSDCRTQDALRGSTEKIVHVVFWMEDLQFLRGLNFPAVFVDRLEHLSPQDLGAILYWTGGTDSRLARARPRQGEMWESSDFPANLYPTIPPVKFELRIHAWNLMSRKAGPQTDFPSALQGVLRGLTQPCRLLEIYFDNIFVTLPSPAGWDAWAYARRQASAKLLRECLLDAKDNGLFEYYEPQSLVGHTQPPLPPHPLLRARDALYGGRQQDYRAWFEQRQDLLAAYEAAFDAEVIRPLIEQSLTSPCARRKAVGLLLATLIKAADCDLQRVEEIQAMTRQSGKVGADLTAAMAQSRQSSNQLLRFLQFEARAERPELGTRRLSRSHPWDRLLGALPPGEQRDHPRHAT